ncbi:hypothetical protein DTO164E3_5807 [Paecilomyces variotii]|nr:hypothetical protein DTO164E3_5807 [Paecilomyces variotii]KAJ9410084.1 hypothetical protein DTO045G8_2077 [Paecilomyces variotii]
MLEAPVDRSPGTLSRALVSFRVWPSKWEYDGVDHGGEKLRAYAPPLSICSQRRRNKTGHGRLRLGCQLAGASASVPRATTVICAVFDRRGTQQLGCHQSALIVRCPSDILNIRADAGPPSLSGSRSCPL